MALIKREELASWLKGKGASQDVRVFLFVGERFLCHEAADLLEQTLLQGGGMVHPIDGDQEDISRTLGQLMNFSILPGRQIYRVTDSGLFHSKVVASKIWEKAMRAQEAGNPGAALAPLRNLAELAGLDAGESFSSLSAAQWKTLFSFERPAGDLGWIDRILAGGAAPDSQRTVKGGRGGTGSAEKYVAALEKGVPGQNYLVLSAENVDKRKALYLFIKQHGLVVDCEVGSGSSRAVQQDQKKILQELIAKTLRSFEKKLEPRAMESLLERVGFHPVAVVMELEKAALFVEERPVITCADLDTIVGRTREDALFELTEAFGKRQLASTMVILGRLLENGVHPLAILSTMYKYIRKMLLFRSLMMASVPAWRKDMQAGEFQDTYLPALKETGHWGEMLKGHPYALYMSFKKAQEFSCPLLQGWLARLLEAEYRMKGSSLAPVLILEEMVVAMLAGKTG